MNRIFMAIAVTATLLLQGCAEDEPIVCDVQNVLADGDFEQSPSDWVQSPAGFIIGEHGSPAPTSTGLNYALFLGLDSVEHRIEKTVNIPLDAVSLAISGYRDMESFDIGISDQLTISVLSDVGVPETVHVFDNRDLTEGWVPFRHSAVRDYSGQTITLRLTATADATEISTFAIDDLAVEVEVCGP